MYISTTARLIVSAAGCIAVNLFLLGLAFANNIVPDVYFTSVIVSFAVLMGLLYAIVRTSRSPRLMYHL